MYCWKQRNSFSYTWMFYFHGVSGSNMKTSALDDDHTHQNYCNLSKTVEIVCSMNILTKANLKVTSTSVPKTPIWLCIMMVFHPQNAVFFSRPRHVFMFLCLSSLFTVPSITLHVCSEISHIKQSFFHMFKNEQIHKESSVFKPKLQG